MKSNKTISKETLKELYNESKKRIKIILNLLGRVDPNSELVLPDDKSFQSIANLINSIMSSAHFEPNNHYRDAIVNIATWLNNAFTKDYLLKNKNASPNPLFVVKKGIEILHSFFHRDLRRKQFSSEENEIYRNYLFMISKLPKPGKEERLSQKDTDALIEEELKKIS